MKRPLLFCLFLFVCNPAFAAHTLDSVPDPKAADGTWVSNPDGVLTSAETADLNRRIDAIEHKTGAQIAVVAVRSIGAAVPKSFAVDLFQRWGIGRKEQDDGLLLLVVIDQRRWEFETGYGLEGDLPDVVLHRIGQEKLLPAFRQGDYGAGIAQAIDAVGARLGVEAERAAMQPAAAQGGTPAPSAYDREQRRYNQGVVLVWSLSGWLVVLIVAWFLFRIVRERYRSRRLAPIGTGTAVAYYTAVSLPPVVMIANHVSGNTAFDVHPALLPWLMLYPSVAAMLFACRLLRNRTCRASDPYIAHLRLSKDHELTAFAAIFLPLPYLPYLLWLRERKQALREEPRLSSTGQIMRRVSETLEDRFLNAGQQREEALQSVDYDVWASPDDSEIKIEMYRSQYTKYQACDKCHFVTRYVKSDETLVAATSGSTGEGVKTLLCEHCGDESRVNYVIPKVSSSGSSGGSSGSSGSGSSFGGGSSGGGGSGGSW